MSGKKPPQEKKSGTSKTGLFVSTLFGGAIGATVYQVISSRPTSKKDTESNDTENNNRSAPNSPK